jgi:hypothetical protein
VITLCNTQLLGTDPPLGHLNTHKARTFQLFVLLDHHMAVYGHIRVRAQHMLRSPSVSVAVSGFLMLCRVSWLRAISNSSFVGMDTLIMATLQLSLATRFEPWKPGQAVGLLAGDMCLRDIVEALVKYSQVVARHEMKDLGTRGNATRDL